MLNKVVFILYILFPLMLLAQTNFNTSGQPKKLAGVEGDYFIQPIMSPDGTKIAFTESNYKGLWVINNDGSELRQISEEIGAGFDFSWSADSREILTRVYKYDGKKRQNAIKSINIENGSETNLSGYGREKLGIPKWTADFSQVYYLKDENIVKIEMGRTLKSEEQRPFVYQSNSILYSDLNSSVRRISSDGNNASYLNVRVSPNGQKVAYEVMGGNLFTMNIDGTGVIDLGTGYNARWSPDSQYLVYMINTDNGHTYLSSDLFIIKSDGKEKIKITDTSDQLEMNPAWSADGKKIVFNTYADGAIYVMKVAD
jgi:Tol biopolymer transport system component